MKQFQDKRIKNYSLDQTIEKILDEINYENKIETLIRDHICLNLSISSSKSDQNQVLKNIFLNFISFKMKKL